MNEDRIVGEVKKIGGKLEAAASDLADDGTMHADGTATEIEGTVQNLYGQAKDTVRDLAGQASDIAADALAAGRERFPEAEKAYRQGAAAIEGYAKASPMGVLLTAAAIGYLVSFLIHGRK